MTEVRFGRIVDTARRRQRHHDTKEHKKTSPGRNNHQKPATGREPSTDRRHHLQTYNSTSSSSNGESPFPRSLVVLYRPRHSFAPIKHVTLQADTSKIQPDRVGQRVILRVEATTRNNHYNYDRRKSSSIVVATYSNNNNNTFKKIYKLTEPRM